MPAFLARSLARRVGWTFFPIAFLGRLPLAMIVVGVTTAVAAVRDSLAEAGLVSAVVGVASAFAAPLVGGSSDRWGQRVVLWTLALAHTAALALLTAVILGDWPLWTLLGVGFLTGATSPQVGALTRARWVQVLKTHDDSPGKAMDMAMGYESTADELTFVLGPVVVGLAATLLTPVAPLMVAAAMTLVFVGLFAAHRTAVVPAALGGFADTLRPDERNRGLLTAPVLIPVAGMVCIGSYFGAVLTSLTAFMSQFGRETETGIIYGAMGLGSALFAIAVVALPRKFTLDLRWALASGIMLAASLMMPFIASIPLLVGVLFLAGVGLGPNLVTLFSIGSSRAPAHRTTTVMTMLSSGIIIGQAVASAANGWLTQNHGHVAGFWVVAGTTAALAALATANLTLSGRGASRA